MFTADFSSGILVVVFAFKTENRIEYDKCHRIEWKTKNVNESKIVIFKETLFALHHST